MQIKNILDAIEARAGSLNVSLPVLCRDAGVQYSTIYRWRHGQSSPLLETFRQHTAALERELSKREREMRRRLSA